MMSTCETQDHNSQVVGNTELQVKMKRVLCFCYLGSLFLEPNARCCGIYAQHFPEITSNQVIGTVTSLSADFCRGLSFCTWCSRLCSFSHEGHQRQLCVIKEPTFATGEIKSLSDNYSNLKRVLH